MRSSHHDTSRERWLAALAPALTALTLGALAAGCDTNYWDPTRFGPLRDTAPVVVLPSPGTGPLGGRFGEVVIGVSTFVPYGTAATSSVFLPASRIGVAGGESSSFFVLSGFDDAVASGGALTTGVHPTFPTRLMEGCTDLVYCGEGAGRSMTALPSWSYEGVAVHGCIASPAGVVTQRPLPPNEMIQIRCETAPDTIGFVDVPDGIEFGASAAPLPMSSDGCSTSPHPIGAALFGAPADAGGAGAVYVLQPPPFANVEAVELGLTLPAGAGLGSTLATSARPDGTVLVAASTIGAPRLVVVFSLAPGAGTTPTPMLHACLAGAGASFGHALAFGDLDGDGRAELAVGAADPTAMGVAGVSADAPVSIWATEPLLALHAAGCDAAAEPAPDADLELGCPTNVPGLVCGTAAALGNAGFGASLAVGDVDGDSEPDLVVGAPLTRASTGAVVVFPGGSSLDRLGTEVGHVASSTMRENALLGYSVATIRGTDRDEIVAGAPGVAEVAVFLCTELDGDRASEAPRDAIRVCVRRVPGVAAPMCSARDGGLGADAGVPSDAPGMDAGELDAGEPDAGEPDAGDLDADLDSDLATRIDAP